MGNVDKITKLTEQYNKALELAARHRDKAKEHAELAEKHEKRAGDLEKEIKYQKGDKIYDRVNALDLTADELSLVLRLLDDKAQLMDTVQLLFPEKMQDNTAVGSVGEPVSGQVQDSSLPPASGSTGEDTDGKEDEEEYGDEVPVFDEDPVFDEEEDDMEDTDGKGDGEYWSA